MINNIPGLLQYFIPGYWVLFLFCFLTSKKINATTKNILSCVISYILLSLIYLIRNIIPLNLIPNNALSNSALSLIIGTIFSILISFILINEKTSKILTKFFYKTINDNIWRDVLDLENGSNLKVYVKDKDYYVIGSCDTYEENGDSSWISISGFAKYDKITNKEYNNEEGYINDYSVLYVIRLSDIEHIEVFN